MNRIGWWRGAALGVLIAGSGLVPTGAAEPHRVTGDVVLWSDERGRVVLAVDAVEPDGLTDELYLLAPAAPGAFDVARRGASGTVTWSEAGGYVTVSDAAGVDRWTLSTRPRTGGASTFRGVELIRLAGSFGVSPWAIDTSDVPSVLDPAPTSTSSEDPRSSQADCQSGGVGATSCSRRCTLTGPAGGTSCDVSCGDGYYACCGCTYGLIAKCYCRVAPASGLGGGEGETPGIPDPGTPKACWPSCGG